jgi:hypothetical protein
MKRTPNLFQTITKTVQMIRIIDTHEHLLQEKERIARKPDLFGTFLENYVSSDLVSAGMQKEDLEKVRDSRVPLQERWRLFKPFWERVENTGFSRALKIAARDLYGVDGLNDQTYKRLALRMEKANKAGLYRWILKGRCGIDMSILDSSSTPLEHVDRGFFAPVARFDDFAMCRDRNDIETLGKRCGRRIHSFSEFVGCLELEFEKLSKVIVGVKTGLAYLRSLDFKKVSQSDAEEVFASIFDQEYFRTLQLDSGQEIISEGLSLKDTKPFQDFIVHKIIQLAAEKKLPMQIHTGFQEGNENIITNSDPTLLINLFREYQEVRFDIFHGSYPYTGELAALAKNFPNVYIDMCWLHIISPSGARRALSEWLDVVPWNKIFGFGGDYVFVEGVYGHAVIARENISRVLMEKVEEGSFTKEQAISLARKLLRDNAYEFFSLNRFTNR